MQIFKKIKTRQNKKRIFPFLLAIGVAATPLMFVSASYKSNQNLTKESHNKKIIFNDEKLHDFASKKVIKRSYTPAVSIVKNKQGQTIKQVDTSYQIRVNLNYGINNNSKNIDEDVKYFSDYNEHFYKLMSSKLKDVVSYKASRLFPFVWIIFSNRSNRKKNLEFLASKSFVKSIISYDEQKELDEQSKNVDPNIWAKFSKNILYHKLDRINFLPQRSREDARINSSNYKNTIGAIGIMELGAGIVEEGLDPFKDKQIEVFKRYGQAANTHSNLVAAIAGGRTGVDRFAKIYSAGVWSTEGLDWHDKIEWMIIDKHVRVINHSYGTGSKIDNQEYLENSYILDYLSRKYGVINVFAAGNGQADPKNDNEWIDGIQLAFNGISVGAADSQYNFRATPFSNWTKDEKYKELPKPLVLAPGEQFYVEGIGLKGRNNHGTSFAAPMVSGAISVLLREKSKINTDGRRLQSILAILAASSKIPINLREEVQPNGLYKTMGAGMIDFEKMLEATDNLYLRTIHKNQNDYVFEANPITLDEDETLQVALAWLFNAGILSQNEKTSKGLITNEIDEEDAKYKNSSWLTFNETLARQKQAFFSDYDIFIEHEASRNNWVTLLRTKATKSNVELIRFKAHEKGSYRVRILKYSNAVFDNSLSDQIALSFTRHKKTKKT